MEVLRTLLLVVGWPLLIGGSAFLFLRAIQFYHDVGKNVWGKIGIVIMGGWFVGVCSTVILGTVYVMDQIVAVRIVFPIFLIWLFLFILLSWVSYRWREEAVNLGSSYEKLEKIVKERTVELDETAKVLIRRDLELTESNERLRDLDEIKSQFVSVAAHQLRTPLAGIKWTLYALLEQQVGKLNTDQEKYAVDAYEATIRLVDLVNDLLDVSRLEEGKFGFNIQRKDLALVVKNVYEGFKSMAKNKGIHYSLVLPKEKLPLLDIDEEKVGIALENFIENAVKYTAPPGSVSVKVTKERENVSVEVSDTGIGVPKDQASRVFEKFFRGENAQLYQTSGTGLGLYVSKNIIENHDGAIYFETPGRY